MRQTDKRRYRWNTRLKITLRITTDDWSTNVMDVSWSLLAWTKINKYKNSILLLFNEWNIFLSHIFNFGQHLKQLQTAAVNLNMINISSKTNKKKLGLPFHRHKQIQNLKTISRLILLCIEGVASYCKIACPESTADHVSCRLIHCKQSQECSKYCCLFNFFF